jgi:hypothetical protein
MQPTDHITEQEAWEYMQFAIVFVVFMSTLSMLFILAGAQ